MPTGSPHCGEWDTALKRNKEKRPGIRRRISLSLLLFGAALVLMLWLFQIVFLESFYRSYRIRQVTATADSLATAASPEEMQEMADLLAVQGDVCVLLLDGELTPLVSAEGTRNCLIHRMGAQDLARWCEQAQTAGKPVTRLFRVSAMFSPGQLPAEALPPGDGTGETPRLDTADASETRRGRRSFGDRFGDWENDSAMALIYARDLTLQDGTEAVLLLNTRISPVSSTVSALRAQMTLITLLVMVGVGLLAWGISGWVSRPIIETNEAARSLAKSRYERPAHADGYREIAELNTTLERAAEELGQVEHLQHELIANISHDLRTPLTMIGGYAEAMRDIPDENTPENMQIIIDETARLSTLVSELLDFSRMQAGGVAMHIGPFCLTDGTEEIVRRVGKLVEKDGYRVVFAPAERLWVEGDATRIGQVIYNLLGNALTYTGGDKTVTVQQTLREGRVRLEVRDTGKGIAPEELPLIWNRYYRTKETHRRAVIGSGLGLNIVRGILEQHGVPYGVESREGEGTTFWFELNRTEPPEQQDG